MVSPINKINMSTNWVGKFFCIFYSDFKVNKKIDSDADEFTCLLFFVEEIIK